MRKKESKENEKNVDDDEKRKQKKIREKERFQKNMTAGDFSNLLTKVGNILNLYPDTRDSDVKLSLNYWETYQPEYFCSSGIMPKDLFKLERMTNITRARAKIQNDFGLFQAKEEIRRARKKNEDEMTQEVLENVASRPLIQVYADETGKTDKWLIVGAIWFLDPKEVYGLTRAIEKWKVGSVWEKREIHFTRFGKNDVTPLREFLEVVLRFKSTLGFKFIAVERAKLKRSVEDAVVALHELMVKRGVRQEVSSGRVTLPRKVVVVIDEDESLDKLALDSALSKLNEGLKLEYNDDVIIESFQSTSSRHSLMIQLADLVTGSINRKLNHENTKNVKDEMATIVLESLGISLKEEISVEEFDASVLVFL